MDNIIKLTEETSLDIDPNRVLESAVGELQTAIVLGYDKTDKLYMALSTGDLSENILLIEQAKFKLMADWSCHE